MPTRDQVLQYLRNWTRLFDVACNVLLGGDSRMTLSARMGRDIAAGRCHGCKILCGWLNLIEPDHCWKAWQSEQIAVDASGQAPPV